MTGEKTALPPELKATVEVIVDAAQMLLREKGELTAVAFLFRKSGRMELIQLDMTDDLTKEIMGRMLRVRAREIKADLYVMVSEVWMVEAKADSVKPGSYPRASQHPDRVEAVMFNVETAGTTYMGISKIRRPHPEAPVIEAPDDWNPMTLEEVKALGHQDTRFGWILPANQ